jgi:pimeloyl-[acyl-carrier protein] methyl ester esterase
VRTAWLHRQQREERILFMAGWGMDPRPFTGIPARSCDIVMVYDYRELTPLAPDLFRACSRLHLVAWSMGVWVSSHLLTEQADAFTSSTAIGGTLTPVDNSTGIPVDDFDRIADTLDQAALTDFYQAMFESPEQVDRFRSHAPERPIDEIHSELVHLKQGALTRGPGQNVFSHRIITGRDRIFPARNQLRAWGRSHSTTTSWPHFPFYQLTDWQDILPSPLTRT